MKYTVEIKKNRNVSTSNFTNHNYNYNHLKNNQKDYYNEGNINIQRPANDIMKIDDLIKNENIPLKKDLKNSNNGNSGNNSSSRKNNLSKLFVYSSILLPGLSTSCKKFISSLIDSTIWSI